MTHIEQIKMLQVSLRETTDMLEDWWKAAGSPPHATELALIEARAALQKAEAA